MGAKFGQEASDFLISAGNPQLGQQIVQQRQKDAQAASQQQALQQALAPLLQGAPQEQVNAINQLPANQAMRLAEKTAAKQQEDAQRKGLLNTFDTAPGLNPTVRALGRSLVNDVGSKAAQQFLSSAASGQLTQDRAITIAKEKQKLSQEGKNVFNKLKAGVANGELAPDADEDAINGYLSGQGLKLNAKQLEDLTAQAQKQGIVKEGESLLGVLFGKTKELFGMGSPAAETQQAPQSDRVRVQMPDGSVGSIPRNQIQALPKGAKVLN